MSIYKPELPPREGYTEIEINGIREYLPIKPVITPDSPDIDLMADAYREGVNEAE